MILSVQSQNRLVTNKVQTNKVAQTNLGNLIHQPKKLIAFGFLILGLVLIYLLLKKMIPFIP